MFEFRYLLMLEVWGWLGFETHRPGSSNGYDDSSGATRHRRNTTTSYTIPVYTSVVGSSTASSMANGSMPVETPACTACGVNGLNGLNGLGGDAGRGDTPPSLPCPLPLPSPSLRIGLRMLAASPLTGFSRSRWSTLCGGGGASGDADVGASSEAAEAAAGSLKMAVGSVSSGGGEGGVCFCFGDMALRSNPLLNSSNASSSSSSRESESEPYG